MKSTIVHVKSIEGLLYNGMGISQKVPATAHGEGLVLNLGSGNSPIVADCLGVMNLDRPEWEAPMLPVDDESVRLIHAYHFLEHLTGDMVREMLWESQRVLKPGGVMNICVPHSAGAMAFQDLDHKSFYTEETWQKLLANPYYDTAPGAELPWRLHVHFNLIAGDKARNLALLTQLQKEQ